jgi:cupin superfamily acireductone dioxygenase involved in methionine salvage
LNFKKNPIEIEINKLGEKLDTHIEKYILDHAYTDKKMLGALIGMVIFCAAGFIGF